MEDPNAIDRDEVITDLRKDAVNLARLGAKVALLERELDLKKRELHQLSVSIHEKQERISATPAEKKDLGALLRHEDTHREAFSLSLLQRWEEVDKEKSELGCEDVTCFFDHPASLQVTIHHTDQPSETIDLIESIKASPRNIGHPLVVEAITRYCLILAKPSRKSGEGSKDPLEGTMTANVARDNLDRIFRALIVGSEMRKKPIEKHMFSLLSLGNENNSEYFASVWNILQEPQVKTALRGGTKLARVKQRLLYLYPERDHDPTLEYLEQVFSDKVSLPTRGGGEALRNSFLGWKFNIKPKSAKVYLSQALRELRGMSESLPADYDPFNSIKQKDIDGIVEDFLFSSLGMKSLKPYQDLSKLVKVTPRKSL